MLTRVTVFDVALEPGTEDAFFADVLELFTGRFYHFVTESRTLAAGGA